MSSGSITIKNKLFDDPRVRRIARDLRRAGVLPAAAPPALAASLVVGALATLWRYAESHICNDDTLAVSMADIDEIVGIDGFAKLLPVDWLQVLDSETVKLPSFIDHNSASIRQREGSRRRSQRHRERVATLAASRATNGEETGNVTRDGTGTRHATPPPCSPPLTSPSFPPLTLPPLTPPSDPAPLIPPGSNLSLIPESIVVGGEPAASPPIAKVRKARDPKAAPARRCPPTFVVTAELRDWAAKACPTVNLERETARLRDHEFVNARADWPAVWRNWLRTSADRGAASARGPLGGARLGPEQAPTPAEIAASRARAAAENASQLQRAGVARPQPKVNP